MCIRDRTWGVSASEITTKAGVLSHSSGKSAKYGEMASKAATLAVPKEVKLKAPKDFSIVSHSKKNTEGVKVVTGKPLFGMDYRDVYKRQCCGFCAITSIWSVRSLAAAWLSVALAQFIWMETLCVRAACLFR